MSERFERLPLPPRLADAAEVMAPAFLRRRLTRIGSPYHTDDTTTFVYIGEAEAVRVLVFMARFPEIPPLVRILGTEVWHSTVALPRGSRVEYRYEVTSAAGTDVIGDPLNRETASDPFGVNSVVTAPGYTSPTWASRDDSVPSGSIETVELESNAFGGLRQLSAYLPADHPSEAPYPLVVFHDGSDLLEYASLATVLDNLIAAGRVRPLVGLLLDPVHRNREYIAAPDHGRFVVDDVLPYAERSFSTATDPTQRLIAGASLGAVASLATAWRHPGSFASMILLSGSFVAATGGPWDRSVAFQPIVDFIAEFAGNLERPTERAWVSCGRYEALAGDNRAFVPELAAAGMTVRYAEPRDGHHWTSWRDGLGAALEELAPGEAAAETGSVG